MPPLAAASRLFAVAFFFCGCVFLLFRPSAANGDLIRSSRHIHPLLPHPRLCLTVEDARWKRGSSFCAGRHGETPRGWWSVGWLVTSSTKSSLDRRSSFPGTGRCKGCQVHRQAVNGLNGAFSFGWLDGVDWTAADLSMRTYCMDALDLAKRQTDERLL
ncbi:hypothetical protein HDK77DRAFT_459428, partial [Phyllosticta capitalensis]